jgi:hypothetical protein
VGEAERWDRRVERPGEAERWDRRVEWPGEAERQRSPALNRVGEAVERSTCALLQGAVVERRRASRLRAEAAVVRPCRVGFSVA